MSHRVRIGVRERHLNMAVLDQSSGSLIAYLLVVENESYYLSTYSSQTSMMESSGRPRPRPWTRSRQIRYAFHSSALT